MALAYGNFHELSHQIRFLLFEIGIGLPQNSIDYFITLAHREALKRLQYALIAEQLIEAPIASHHVHDLLDQLQIKLKKSLPASQFFQWNTLRKNLDESIANDALAQAYKQCWNTQIKNEALHYNSLWSWIIENQTSYQTLMFLEQWGCQGNSYQPAFRAKKGFTRREVLQNSPEFQAKISIHWCALSKQKAFIPIQATNFHTQIETEFPKEYAHWRERLILNHLDPDDYYPIPVHPWQWRNQIQPLCATMIDKKSLILLPHHQSLIPSMSAGMMLPLASSNSLIHLSLANNTSETPHHHSTSLNCCHPQLEHWLNSLLIRDNNYDSSLFLVNRLTSISLHAHDIPEYEHKKFSASIHQNPIHLINKNQKLVPLPSLFANSPITNVPLIIEIIQESGLTPLSYFALYCRKVLFSSIQLFLKHGIVFETSVQNTSVIFEEHKPQGLILKELTDIKISDRSPLNTGENPERPATALKTAGMGELRASLIQNTLQQNIKRWVNTLNIQLEIPKKLLWDEVHQTLNTLFNELTNEIEPRILQQQKDLLLHEAWLHQCLFTMELSAHSFPNFFVPEENPLAE